MLGQATYCLLFLIMPVASTFAFDLDVRELRANDTELLVTMAYQSLPLTTISSVLFEMVESNFKFVSMKNMFAQQQGVYPQEGSLQLESFGALQPWEDILSIVNQEDGSKNKKKLLIMVRHGQAWENLNPYSNDVCEFEYDGLTINNFDSDLTPLGIKEAQQLNVLLRSPATSNYSNITTAQARISNNDKSWYETLGLNSAAFFTSPLTRAMRTTEEVLCGSSDRRENGLCLCGDSPVTAAEMMRASIGTDVCNFRRSVKTPTSYESLPSPWDTGCDSGSVPSDSLVRLYATSQVNFSFPIRPAGGEGIGLLSDSDMLWRNDIQDSSQVTRARVFVNQLFENVKESVVYVTTHGEMIDAMYQALGDESYSPLNTEVVPVIIERKVQLYN